MIYYLRKNPRKKQIQVEYCHFNEGKSAINIDVSLTTIYLNKLKVNPIRLGGEPFRGE